MNRPENLQQLLDTSKVWDIVIIGGGASGLGVALDAVSRGLSVALFEKADFAKGTSSRSTKLLHGGVRYLAQGDVFLVLEALRERGRLLKNAPHLTQNQAFIIPVFSRMERIKYSAGLKVYDYMAANLSLGPSRFISKEETLKRLPGLAPQGLFGGIVYQDGQFDDARLALSIAQTADHAGACILNYSKVTSLLKNEEGKIRGVQMKDEISGKKYTLQAKMVVNATGVFADKILKMDNPEASKTIQPSQGIHLVLDLDFLGGKDALMIPKTRDGRVLFAVPWHGKLVVGTTDTLREKPKLEPEALQKEINFVLETASAYLHKKPTREDVKAVFAGLRPLARPKEGSTKTKEISRSHKIIISESGLVSITGGKWTTFRKMGEDTVATFTKITGEALAESKSKDILLHGYTKEIPSGHWGVYGSDAELIQVIVQENPLYARKIHPKFDNILAEVIWSVRKEMAFRLEDVLSRRIRMLILDAKAAKESAQQVAEIMALELQKGPDWIAAELEDFYQTVEKYLIK